METTRRRSGIEFFAVLGALVIVAATTIALFDVAAGMPTPMRIVFALIPVTTTIIGYVLASVAVDRSARR